MRDIIPLLALFILSLILPSQAGLLGPSGNITFDDTDPAWVYTPPVCDSFCDGSQAGVPQSWFQLAKFIDPVNLNGFFNLTTTGTNLVGATAEITFNGVAFTLFGSMGPLGAVIELTIDNEPSLNVSSLLPNTTQQHQAPIYTRSGLDGTKPHVLHLAMLGGSFLEIDRLDVTPFDPDATPSGVVTVTVTESTPTPSIPPRLVGSSGATNNIPAIVGGTIGGILILVIMLVLICLIRRNRRRSQKLVVGPGEDFMEVGPRVRISVREFFDKPKFGGSPVLPLPSPSHPYHYGRANRTSGFRPIIANPDPTVGSSPTSPGTGTSTGSSFVSSAGSKGSKASKASKSSKSSKSSMSRKFFPLPPKTIPLPSPVISVIPPPNPPPRRQERRQLLGARPLPKPLPTIPFPPPRSPPPPTPGPGPSRYPYSAGPSHYGPDPSEAGPSGYRGSQWIGPPG